MAGSHRKRRTIGIGAMAAMAYAAPSATYPAPLRTKIGVPRLKWMYAVAAVSSTMTPVSRPRAVGLVIVRSVLQEFACHHEYGPRRPDVTGSGPFLPVE